MSWKRASHCKALSPATAGYVGSMAGTHKKNAFRVNPNSLVLKRYYF